MDLLSGVAAIIDEMQNPRYFLHLHLQQDLSMQSIANFFPLFDKWPMRRLYGSHLLPGHASRADH